ncbi:MAG TPA: hypothetical protein VFS33_11405 [Gemmatimonadales bacterium]|nr:hypothetical protein [Gemmatimonadales bacterium]
MPSLAEMIADPSVGLRVALVVVALFGTFCVVCTAGLWWYLGSGDSDAATAHGAKERSKLAA